MDGKFGGTLRNQHTTMKVNVVFQPKPAVSVILTLTGILIGLLFSMLAVWADYESTSYGFMKRASAPLRGLRCPIFLGRDETGTVSINVSNSTGRPLSPSVRTEISTSQDVVSDLEFIQLGPGKQAMVQRTVGPENIDLGSFIFVSASVYSIYPLPDQENTCGIFVLPIAKGSSFILILSTTMSLLLMSVGVFSLYRNALVSKRSRALLFMAVATALAIFFSFMGWWVQPLLLIIMVVLTFLISLGSML